MPKLVADVLAQVPEIFTPINAPVYDAIMTVVRMNNVLMHPEGMPYITVDGVQRRFAGYLQETTGHGATSIAEFQHMIAALDTYNPENFKLLTGDGLVAAYINSVGEASCATGASRTPLLKMYVDNPEVVKLLVWKMRARALVWRFTNGDLGVDRMYPMSGEHVYHYKLWANQRNAWMRNARWAEEDSPWLRRDGESRMDLKVAVVPPFGGQMPALDSLNSGPNHLIGGKLYLCTCGDVRWRELRVPETLPDLNDEMGSALACLEEYARMRGRGDVAICPWCGKEIEPGTGHETETWGDICPECYENEYYECELCECEMQGANHAVFNANINMVNLCEDCWENHAWTCPECEDEYTDDMEVADAHCAGDDEMVQVCMHCIRTRYVRCPACAEYWPEDDVDDDNNCPNCRD